MKTFFDSSTVAYLKQFEQGVRFLHK